MSQPTIVVQPRTVVVTRVPARTKIISAAVQGPQGIQGASTTTFPMVAGSVLSGHRLVTADSSGHAIYADHDTLAHANAVIGMTTGAAAAGAPATIQSAGELEEPSFTFTPGQVLFLGSNGTIVTAPPTTGFSLVIGFAETATKIFLNIGMPIVLG